MALCFSSFHRITGVLFILALLLGCQGVDEGGAMPPPRLPGAAPLAKTSSEARFVSGDSLELLVEEDPSFNGVFEVREGGYVLIPKIGRVMVAGLDRDAAERRIKDSLQKQQLKLATVFVELRPRAAQAGDGLGAAGDAYASPRVNVFLTGAVARPGQHALPLQAGGRTPGVFEAILMTGGLAKFGDESKVRIMRLNDRGARTPLLVDIRKIRDGLAPDVPVGDGDVIQVPEKVFGF